MLRKLILIGCISLLFILKSSVLALEECSGKSGSEAADCWGRRENELKNLISQSQGQQKTLASTIAYLNNKTALIEAQIKQTETELKKLEEEIAVLSVKIVRLDENLDNISKLLVERIGAAYKRSLFKPIYMLFSTDGLTGFFEKAKYLQFAQENDRNLLLEMQNSKNQHEQQKKMEEEKQKQAETLKIKLATQNSALLQQKMAKIDLLEQTKNNEQTYQQLLINAQQEYQAILGILAGKGIETEIGHVDEGQKIASIIQGPSCNSSNTHLHFMISDNGSAKNPFSYLKNIDNINCSGPGECSGADSFSPAGDWNWPINARIRFSQGYGYTWAIQNTWVGKIYQFHNGIDINSESSSVVKAVKSGTLYKGTFLYGCALSYVRVDHDNSNLDTFYLHVYH